MSRFRKSLFLTVLAFLDPIILAQHYDWQISTYVNSSNLAQCLSQLLVLIDENVIHTKNVRISLQTRPGLPKLMAGDLIDSLRGKQNDLKIVYEILYSPVKPLVYEIHNRVIIVDSYASFRTIIKRQRKRTYDINGLRQDYNIILMDYQEETVVEVMEKIFALCLENYIVDINVLVEDASGIVTIYTYFPFTDHSCRKATPTIYNRFIAGQLQWKRVVFPPKVRNLWRCPVRAITWHKPPFVFIKDNDVSGIDGNFLKHLSKAMNFTLDYYKSPQGLGEVYTNGTIQDGDGDLIVGGTVCTNLRRRHFSCTNNYYTTSVQVILKKPTAYSSFEILLFPFDTRTWYTFGLFLLLNLFLRSLWNKISLHVSPNARILSTRLQLMTWLLSIIIIRSSYEGSIFRFLHNKPMRRVPSNFEAALAEGYNFVASSTYLPFIKHIPHILDRLTLTTASLAKLFDELDKYNGKYGLINLDNYLTVIANDSSRYGLYVEMSEPIVHNIVCVYLPKFSFFTKELNRQIELMINYGHMERVYDISVKDQLRRMNSVEKSGVNSIPLMEIIGDFELLICLIGFGWVCLGFEVLATRFGKVKKIVDFFH